MKGNILEQVSHFNYHDYHVSIKYEITFNFMLHSRPIKLLVLVPVGLSSIFDIVDRSCKFSTITLKL